MYSVGTLRSHSSRYLQVYLAHNTITNTKFDDKIVLVLFIQPYPTPDPSHVLENATHGWTQPRSISGLAKFAKFKQIDCENSMTVHTCANG